MRLKFKGSNTSLGLHFYFYCCHFQVLQNSGSAYYTWLPVNGRQGIRYIPVRVFVLSCGKLTLFLHTIFLQKEHKFVYIRVCG